MTYHILDAYFWENVENRNSQEDSPADIGEAVAAIRLDQTIPIVEAAPIHELNSVSQTEGLAA